MKVLFVGIYAPSFEVAESLCQTPSLFDYDAIIIDADAIWPPQMQEALSQGAITEVTESHFGPFNDPLSAKRAEANLLLKKGGIIVCLMRPVTAVGYTHYHDNRRSFPSVSSYDWIPIDHLRNYVISGKGVRTTRVKSSAFDDYLKLKDVEWFAYVTKEFQSTQYEIIAVNNAELAVAARIGVAQGAVYLMPIATHDKMPQILVSDLAKAFRIKTFRPIPPWIGGVHVPGQQEIDERLRKIREEIVEIRSKEELLEKQLEERTSIKLLLYEQGDVLHDIVERVLNELGFMVKREGDKDLVSGRDPSKRVVFEVTGTEGTIDVDKLRQLIDYVATEEKSTGKLPKSVLIGNHQINLNPRERSTAFTDRAVQQSKVYGTCLLPSIELFKAIVAFRESKLDANQLWAVILSTVGIFSLR